ncbi:acyl carrier protein [Candidatus Latescibacterota bacterium]
MSVERRVIRVASQILGGSEADLTVSDSPETVSEWDSLRHMNLILGLEEEFGVTFSDTEMLELVDIQSIVDVTSQKCGE